MGNGCDEIWGYQQYLFLSITVKKYVWVYYSLHIMRLDGSSCIRATEVPFQDGEL